jgi:hypothetical protein
MLMPPFPALIDGGGKSVGINSYQCINRARQPLYCTKPATTPAQSIQEQDEAWINR